jgi:recombination protein U
MVKYPSGIKAAVSTQPKDHHASRGSGLEEDLNLSNQYYRDIDKALIYKKPTPIQVVHVDYPARNKAKITEAYYRTPSTTDYNGIYRGRYIDFEAKETQAKTRFPLFMIHPHQIKHLEKVLFHGGIGFFIIRFSYFETTYLVDARELIDCIHTINRKSIPFDWIDQHGVRIREGLYPRLAYLEAVDEKYF